MSVWRRTEAVACWRSHQVEEPVAGDATGHRLRTVLWHPQDRIDARVAEVDHGRWRWVVRSIEGTIDGESASEHAARAKAMKLVRELIAGRVSKYAREAA